MQEPIPSYAAVHRRLRQRRGRAADLICRCGQPARQWAYDHSDPNEQIDPRCGAYSADLNRYVPMCLSCHARFDAARRVSGQTSCARGLHPYPENLFFAGKRKDRRCRGCENARKRRLSQKKRDEDAARHASPAGAPIRHCPCCPFRGK